MSEVVARTDLAAWLLACVQTDEDAARAATAGPWTVNDTDYPESVYADDGAVCVIGGGRWGGEARVFEQDADALHIVRWDPARVLVECDTKRRIIEDCAPLIERQDWEYTDTPDLAERTLRLLALPYADRPGYRAEWAPDGR